MSEANVTIDGLDELNRRLESLEDEFRPEELSRGVEEAAAVLLNPLASAAPEGETGRTKRSIGLVVRNYGDSSAMAIVGARFDLGFAAKWVEKGTQQRQTRKGYNRGRVSPNPFTLRTFEEYKGQVQARLTDFVSSKLIKQGAE